MAEPELGYPITIAWGEDSLVLRDPTQVLDLLNFEKAQWTKIHELLTAGPKTFRLLVHQETIAKIDRVQPLFTSNNAADNARNLLTELSQTGYVPSSSNLGRKVADLAAASPQAASAYFLLERQMRSPTKLITRADQQATNFDMFALLEGVARLSLSIITQVPIRAG